VSAVSPLWLPPLQCLQRYLAGGTRKGAHRQDFSPEESVHAQCECQAADTDEDATRNPAANGRHPIRHMPVNDTLNPTAVIPRAPQNPRGLLGDPELTMRSRINFLGRDAAVRHHRSMQLGDRLTTRFDEQKGEDRMDETGAGSQQHPAAEPRGSQQMAPVGFPD
jgi:hypothetical protein